MPKYEIVYRMINKCLEIAEKCDEDNEFCISNFSCGNRVMSRYMRYGSAEIMTLMDECEKAKCMEEFYKSELEERNCSVCRNCSHWKQKTDNTGECRHFNFLCESVFYCADWSDEE